MEISNKIEPFYKRTLSAMFLFIFIFNIFGSLIVFTYQQSKHRKEVWNSIEIENSTLLKFSKKSFKEYIRFEPNKKEFYFRRNLYDLTRKIETSDSVYLYCINDKVEESLIEKFQKEDANSKSANSIPNKAGIKLFHFNADVEKIKFCAVNISHEQTTFNCISLDLYKSYSNDIDSPPPKQFLG